MEYLEELSTKDEKKDLHILAKLGIIFAILIVLTISAWIIGVIMLVIFLWLLDAFPIFVWSIFDFIDSFVKRNKDFIFDFTLWIIIPLFFGFLIILGVLDMYITRTSNGD